MALLLSPRVNIEDMGQRAPTILTLYFFFHISAGHVLLPIMLLVFLFSKTVVRHGTLINVVISFIISSIAACILLYAGKASGPEPSQALCVLQSGMLNAVGPMWSVAILMFVYHIWTRFSREPEKNLPNPITDGLILAAPYVVFGVWSIAGVLVAVSHVDRLDRHRRFFYCSVRWDPFTNVMSSFSALACFLSLFFMGHTAVILYRNWRVLRAAGQSGGVDVFFVMRVFLFGLYIAAGMALSLVAILNSKTAVPDMYASTIGLAVALIFGTQADVFRALLFWRNCTRITPITVSQGRGWTRQFDLADEQKPTTPQGQV